MARVRDARAEARIVEVDGPRYVVISLRPPKRRRLRRKIRALLAEPLMRDAVLAVTTMLLVGFLLTCFLRAIESAPGAIAGR